MSSEAAHVLEQVLALPEEDRKYILTKTWQSFSLLQDMPTPPPTLGELQRRAQSIDDGTAKLFTEEECEAEMEKVWADYRTPRSSQ